MTPDEILTALKEATNTFGNITLKPTDNEMYSMNSTLPPTLTKTPCEQVDANHNLSGIITPSAKYTTKYGTAFKRPTRPGLYCLTITAPTSNANQRKAEVTNSSHKED